MIANHIEVSSNETKYSQRILSEMQVIERGKEKKNNVK